MKKNALMFLFIVSSCGGCCIFHKSVPKVAMECISNGLIIFNQDGIYYIPKDTCCFLQESDKDIDGLLLVNRVSADSVRRYGYDDMKRIKAVNYYCKYAPNASRRTIPGVNDNTYFIKRDSCYIVFACIRMYSYGEIDKRIESTYPWEVSIAGQDIRINIIEGRRIFFEIERTESIDSILLAEILTGCRFLK